MLTKDTWISEEGFGVVGSDIIRRYTMINSSKASVSLISFGAGIQSIRIPNRKGILGDVVLGWDNIDGYLENRYIGRTIGRTTRIIIDGVINIESENFLLSKNSHNYQHHLNGGLIAFDNVNWDCDIIDKSLIMSHLSRDGSEGYPGDMLTQIKYTWTDENQLFINIRATSTRSTVANISNYCLFNLAGHGTGRPELNKHVVTVNSDKFIFGDENEPPVVRSVFKTVFDLRKPTMLSSKYLRFVPGGGLNHTFGINCPSTWCYRFHARVLHPDSGRFVEVYSDQPGIYLSTLNHFPNPRMTAMLNWGGNNWNGFSDDPHEDSMNDSGEFKAIKLWGKGGSLYKKHCGLLISPQNYSNTVGIKHFPSCILHPGSVYKHNLSFQFGVKV